MPRFIWEDQGDYVRMSKAQFVEIFDQIRFLDALRAAGVDNWEGYSHAYRIMNGEDDE